MRRNQKRQKQKSQYRRANYDMFAIATVVAIKPLRE
jgi:hypothetical protein